MIPSILSVSVGAASGALLRWWLGMHLNSIFPTIPLGTLAANLIGGFLMGVFMALSRSMLFISEEARLAISTGFLGGLTTFSTFSGETVSLFMAQDYLWSMVLIVCHLAGSLLMTLLGFHLIKIFIL